MSTVSDDPILTLDEAAALLKVTPRFLQRSDCPRIRKGKTVRYNREACLAWMNADLQGIAA